MRRARQLAATVWNYARPRIRWRDVIIVALIGLSMLYSVNYYHRSVAAQERQGEQLEAKLCATLDGLASLRPPAGPASANPSRAYEQNLARTLAGLSPDLGCGKAARP